MRARRHRAPSTSFLGRCTDRTLHLGCSPLVVDGLALRVDAVAVVGVDCKTVVSGPDGDGINTEGSDPYFNIRISELVVRRLAFPGHPGVVFPEPLGPITAVSFPGWAMPVTCRTGIMWVVVKIMVPFWVPNTVRHLLFRVPKKGP